MIKIAAAALPLLVGLCACSGTDTPTPPDNTPVTYHRDAQVLLERYCTSCHTDGGIAPFALSDYAAAAGKAQLIKGAVMAGTMPPWMPSDKGQPLRYSRAMRAEDRDLLLRWIDQGAQQGDPATPPRTDIPPAETVTPPRADLVVDTGVTYQPKQNLTDDYHCFISDAQFAQDTYFAAGTIVPGNPSIVHHVIVYEIPAADAAKARALDNGEAGPGYTCFGGPGASNLAQTVLVWAPGSVATRVPQGQAIRIQKGSLLVTQVHYNLVNYRGQGDRTRAELEQSPTTPQKVSVLLPVADPAKLKIAAGDAAAKQIIQVPMYQVLGYLKLPSLEVYGNVPHMHNLGKRIETRIVDGDTLLEVPRWDFHWQQMYQFRTPVTLTARDTLEVECDYDNSLANQPVVNGQRQMPVDVKWGERTQDEMCLSYVQVALDPAIKL